MDLKLHHLGLLLQLKQWAPSTSQGNMPPAHPGLLSDLLELGLVDRNEAWQLRLTSKGEQALQAAVEGLRAVAGRVAT